MNFVMPSDIVMIVFFTVFLPAFFTPILGYQAMFLGLLLLFPSVLSDTQSYLSLWFLFETFVVASMLYKSFGSLGSRSRS
jgi:hypothetical protein